MCVHPEEPTKLEEFYEVLFLERRYINIVQNLVVYYHEQFVWSQITMILTRMGGNMVAKYSRTLKWPLLLDLRQKICEMETRWLLTLMKLLKFRNIVNL